MDTASSGLICCWHPFVTLFPRNFAFMKVLAITLDPELSEFRKYVLSGAGHEVTTIISEKEALKAAQSAESYDVVFVCHRFPSAESRQCIRLFRQHHPHTSIVYVVHRYGEWPEVEADRYITGADGPKALLRVLEELRPASSSMTKN
jgi:DNA-binding response OmpR family regulator